MITLTIEERVTRLEKLLYLLIGLQAPTLINSLSSMGVVWLPKAKADQVIVHRIELQETERDALDIFIASNAAKNVGDGLGSIGDGLGSIISAFTRASLPGTILWGSVLAFLAIEFESRSPGAYFPGTIGQLGANEEVTPFYPKQDGETAKQYRNRTTLSSRLKYGLWTQPRETLKEDYQKLMDLI